MVEGADFLGGVAPMNLTAMQVAAILGLSIALLVGAFVIVQSLQSGTWQVQLVPHAPESADASVDASVPIDGLTPAAQSGMTQLFIGFTDSPRAQVFNFLQRGGLRFDVVWSSVRGSEAHVTMPNSPLPSWTNPTTCGPPDGECGHLAVAVPVNGPPGRPEIWVLNNGAETPIDDSEWHRQSGELTMHGRQFYVVLTTTGDVPAGSRITLKWPLPWDGTGAPPLSAP